MRPAIAAVTISNAFRLFAQLGQAKGLRLSTRGFQMRGKVMTSRASSSMYGIRRRDALRSSTACVARISIAMIGRSVPLMIAMSAMRLFGSGNSRSADCTLPGKASGKGCEMSDSHSTQFLFSHGGSAFPDFHSVIELYTNAFAVLWMMVS